MKDPLKDPDNTVYIPAGYCPECGARHDAAVDAAGKGGRPKPGDLSICVECGCLCEYGSQLTIARFTQYELLSDEERMAVAQAKKFLRERIN